jgi:hypothetical protein
LLESEVDDPPNAVKELKSGAVSQGVDGAANREVARVDVV